MKINFSFVMSAVLCFFPMLLSAQKDTNSILLNELIISAGRVDQPVKQLPASVVVIQKDQLSEMSIQSIDDVLKSVPGITVFRPFGMFGNSNVSLRGLGGNEQGRVLVLQNGVPINKSDLGSVNWNRINPFSVSKIEIIKGPGSTFYGSNAMGGIVNIVTNDYSEKPISGIAKFTYGSFNTYGLDAKILGTPKTDGKWKYNLNANYRKSDGYISVVDSLRDSTHIASWSEEFGLDFTESYTFNPSNKIDFTYNFYNDRRSQGIKILDKIGNAVDHDTHFFRSNYSGQKNKLKWSANVYYQREHYFRIVEAFKRFYSLYHVNSIREDFGFIGNLSHQTERNLFSAGIDFKKGLVNGADEYQTSEDIIRNIGDVNNFSGFLFNDFKFSDYFYLNTAIHYDYVVLNKSEFSIENPSESSEILLPFQTQLSGTDWSTFSPKVSLQYLKSTYKTYISFSSGFRAPTLDDLTRTGFIAGGFKVSNPNLKAEKVNNFESGMSYWNQKLNIDLSVYYTIGEDFMYYTETGEFIFGSKPILIKQNITGVLLYGLEASANYKLSKNIESTVNYAYSENNIAKFDAKPELIGKKLTYSPKHSARIGLLLKTKPIQLSAALNYLSVQYMNDDNTLLIPEQFLAEVKLIKTFKFGLELSASGQNLFNNQYLVYYDQLSLGRFLNFSVSYKF